MEESNKNEILYGSLTKQMVQLALPTMMGYLFQSLYDIVDLVWIGMIDSSAVAAMTLFSTFFWLIETFNSIVGASSVSLIGQYHGAGDTENTRLVSEQTLLFKFLIAVLGGAVMMICLKPLFHMYTNDPIVIQNGLDYGYIRAAFIPIFFSSYSVNTIFRCSGDAKTPMKLLIGAAILNITLDPVLMFDVIPGTNIQGLGMGMKGAAIATVISISLSFFIGFILLFTKKSPVKIRFSHLFKLCPRIDKKLFLIGLPNGIELGLRNVCDFILMKLVSGFGTAALAAVGVALKIFVFAYMPQIGLYSGGSIIIGHCLGAGLKDRAKKTVKETIKFGIISTIIPAFAVIFLSVPIYSLFMNVSEIAPVKGQFLMLMIGISLLLNAVSTGYHCAFGGSGMNKPILYSSAITQYCFMLPYAIVVTKLSLPIHFLWAVFIIGDFAMLMVLRFFYNKNKWLHHTVTN